MTTIAAPVHERDENPPVAQTEDRALRWVGRVGWVVLAMQALAMIVFSIAERDHFDLTSDDAYYYQGFWLIAHGHFRGYVSLGGLPLVKNNGELLTYPLAMLFRPILSETSFIIFQDLCLVAAGAVGLIWILDVVRRPSWPVRFPPWVAVSTYVLLAALNPWLYQSIAWPWHYEPLDALLLILAAYFVEHRQWRRAAVFVALCALTGATGNVLLAGLGIATFLAGRRWRWAGLIIMMAGAGTLLLESSLGLTHTAYKFGAFTAGPQGSNSKPTVAPVTQILSSMVHHPALPLRTLWRQRLNIYANLGPSGIVGFFSPWGFGVSFTSLLISELVSVTSLSPPSFQNSAVYVFVTLGTIFLLRRIALVSRVPRSLSLGLTGLVAANAVLWAAVWLPQIPGLWLRVSSPAAAVIRQAVDTIPSNAEVVASTGIVGTFAGRQWAYQLALGEAYPVKERTVYFVVAPNQGIEGEYVSGALSAIGYIGDNLHAAMVAHGHGVWVFRWHPPKGLRSFAIRGDPNSIPAWTTPGPAGTAVLSGSPADWLAASNGRAGYVVAEDYWRMLAGEYQANVRLSSNVPVNVEVWNESSNTLLARRSISPTIGLEDVPMVVDLSHLASTLHSTPSGSGLFKIHAVPPVPGNSLEIRVWSAGNGGVSVYSLGLRRI